MAFDAEGRWVDTGSGDLSAPRPVPADWPGAPYAWTLYERERLRDAGIPIGGASRTAGEPAGRLGRELQELFASTGLGRERAEQLGRQPTTAEILFGADGAAVPPAAVESRAISDEAAQYTAGARPPVARPEDINLSGIFGDVPAAGGYSPSLVDTSAAEAMFLLEESPQEAASIEALLADLEARGRAGIEAVRGGWGEVQQVNSAAAAKAAQMAQEAGPEAARLWQQAAADVLNLSSQAAQVLGTTPGMQRVNISPTAGSERIAALLAAEAPRAQQLAERMGLASAEQIAAQARTASMMGEAYSGDIQRTMLIEANNARQSHNQRVLDRIAAERQAIGQMRFQAATTNAQLLSQAAAQAAAGARDEPTRRERILNFVDDIERVATFETAADGAGLLIQLYPTLDPGEAARLIESAKQGQLDYQAALAGIE